MEIWKDVRGFEGLYQVSSFGNVRSVDRVQFIKNRWSTDLMRRDIKGKPLRQSIGIRGYPIVSLSKNGRWKTVNIHSLVATAFIPNPERKKEVNHKSHIYTDNTVENLEWCTRSENSIHSKYDNCIGRRFGKNRFTPVVDLQNGVFYYSVKEAALLHGIHPTTLTMYLKGLCRNKTSLVYA